MNHDDPRPAGCVLVALGVMAVLLVFLFTPMAAITDFGAGQGFVSLALLLVIIAGLLLIGGGGGR